MATITYTFNVDDETYTVKVNNTFCGILYKEIDGFYRYELPQEIIVGYIPSWLMRGIADKMDELNEPWQKELEGALSGL